MIDLKFFKHVQSTLAISKFFGIFFTSSNEFALRVIWTCKKVSDAKLWLEKAIKMFY